MSEKHTPGPWNACGDGECQCKLVMYEDGPVAKVISGKWGDEFPNIRLVKNEQGMGEHAEAFVEMIEYGEVNEETATANARLIAAAPDLLAACELALHAFENNWAINWDDLSSAIAKAHGEAGR